MTNKELAALVAAQATEIARLTTAVTALVAHDKAVRAELRARRQPDTLERRAQGLNAWETARQAINAERGVPAKTWVNAQDVRARMTPVVDDGEDVAL